MRPLKFQSEGRELIITKKGENPFFSYNDIKKDKKITDLISEIRLSGIYKYKQISKVNLLAIKDDSNFKGEESTAKKSVALKDNEIILSKQTSKYLNKKIGDKLKISVGEKTHTFKVRRILNNDNNFYSDKKSEFAVIAPYSYLSKSLNQANKVNLVYANAENKSETIKKFNNQNKNFSLKEVYDAKSMNQEISWLKNGLLLILGIILIISVFLIYNAFKIIIEERISEVGTFITLGASKKSIKSIFLLESFIYGLIGSLIGCIISYLTMSLIYREKLSGSSIALEKYNPHFEVYICGILLGILLSMGSCWLSLNILNRETELNIINNSDSNKVLNESLLGIGYFLALGTSLIMYHFANNFAFGCLSLFLFLISLCLFSIIFARLVAKIIRKLNKSKTKELFLLSNDLLNVPELRNCMVLIVIVLFSIMTISSISFSLSDQMKSGFKELNFDYVVQNIPQNSGGTSNTSLILNRLESTPEVSAINPITLATSRDNENGTGVKTVVGINPKEFIAYINNYLKLNKKEQDDLKNTEGKDQVVISKMFSEINQKKVGDPIRLLVNDKKKVYKIASIVDGKTFYNGNFLLITNEKLKKDFDIYETTYIYFKDSQKSPFILKNIEGLGATWASKKDELQSSLKTANSLIEMIQIVSIAAIVIAVIGLLSNMTLMVLKRKSEFFIYSTLGLTTSELKVFLIFEIFTISTLAFVAVTAFLPVVQLILTKIMYLIGMNLNMVVQIVPLVINYIILLVFAIFSNLVILRNQINMH